MNPTLFDALPTARNSDPDTSQAVRLPSRKSQATALLVRYLSGPLTDEEASEAAGIIQGWKRCSDLRRLGLIKDTGLRLVAGSGKPQMVCKITDAGLEFVRSL